MTIDWNLLITALAGLGGVAVGGFVTWKIQERQLKHVDENRFQEQRMTVYIELVKSANIVMAKYITGNIHDIHLEVEKFYDAQGQTQLISTMQTYEKASQIMKLINSIQLKKGLIDDSDKTIKYKAAVESFILEARKELKIDVTI